MSTSYRFTINTTFEHFADKLNDYTRLIYRRSFPTEKGSITLQSARPGRRPLTVEMEGVYLAKPKGDRQLAQPIGPVIELRVVRLSDERIDVTARCYQPVVEDYFRELYKEIERCWPEVREQREAWMVKARARLDELETELGLARWIPKEKIIIDATYHGDAVPYRLALHLAEYTGDVIYEQFPAESGYFTLHSFPFPRQPYPIGGSVSDMLGQFHPNDGGVVDTSWLIRVEFNAPFNGEMEVVVKCKELAVKPYFDKLVEKLRRRTKPIGGAYGSEEVEGPTDDILPAEDTETERASIHRQLSEEKENLLLIQERKSEHVMDTAISLDLIKQERRTQKRIEELERRMMS